ncbi:hypothetical protein PI95_006940 [Hassallia byssoidea VB512170]|uniref:Uncharacterized protein n=1 Tax=Hassallia byssoidea VB512170 TaxID=1304833 RepID=A0A846H526_9CYAN|nr:hypothetical protein [Hassalia byssoidea]NEU72315.1 hypothetical protein [Hassalia byssoidea VB512170]
MVDIPSLYKYVGSEEVQLAVASFAIGKKIQSVSDLEKWIYETKQQTNPWGLIPATFVVDSEGYLRVSDRHSEHIACAGGESVLSAGEIFFRYGDEGLEVAEVTNQSTGFCPEPESWKYLDNALKLILLPHPPGFTIEFIFRRCCACNQVNLVKENVFICAVCGEKLPNIWNFE